MEELKEESESRWTHTECTTKHVLKAEGCLSREAWSLGENTFLFYLPSLQWQKGWILKSCSNHHYQYFFSTNVYSLHWYNQLLTCTYCEDKDTTKLSLFLCYCVCYYRQVNTIFLIIYSLTLAHITLLDLHFIQANLLNWSVYILQ